MSAIDVAQSGILVLSQNQARFNSAQESILVLSRNYADFSVRQSCVLVLSSVHPLPSVQTLESMGILAPEGIYLLVELDINEVIHRLSNEHGVALTHYWDGWILKFDMPGYDIDELYGGYVKISVGGVEISIEKFKDITFPPIKNNPIKIKWTQSTEEEAELLFEGTAHISAFDKYAARYDLYEPEFNQYILEKTPAKDPNAIDIVKYGIYKWYESGNGDYEYYFILHPTGDPEIAEPENVCILGIPAERGNMGSLLPNQWDYGDNDSLGYDTVYFRAYNNAKPEIFIDGYLQAQYTIETVNIPRAFGEVIHQSPLQVTTIGGMPTFWKSVSGILGEGHEITSFLSEDSGKKTKLYIPGHGIGATNVRVTGTINYNGIFENLGGGEDYIIISKEYVSETPSSASQLFRASEWIVFDDGIAVNGNVVDHENGLFSLSTPPAGKVSVTGYGNISTLIELFEYECNNLKKSLNLDGTLDEFITAMPDISYWCDTQALTTDFLSNIASFYSYMFHIHRDTLYLIDMRISTEQYTPDEILDISYNFPEPLKLIKSEWADSDGIEDTKRTFSRETQITYGKELTLEPYCKNLFELKAIADEIIYTLSNLQVQMTVPFKGDIPKPGSQINFTDDTLPQELGGFFRVRSIRPDFNNSEITLIGEMSSPKQLIFQIMAEVARSGGDVDMQVFQNVAEVARSGSGQTMQSFQNVAEVVREGNPQMQVFQTIIEVVRDI